MLKAIIFDFDGVIIESAEIKNEAFKKLFAGYPDKTDAIVDYHKRNMGISRYVKFRYIYKNILNKELSIQKEKELGEKFSRIVYSEIVMAPFVPGAIEFLTSSKERYLFFIASGTPEDELTDILFSRKINKFFREIHGSPAQKKDIIEGILKRNDLSFKEAVFIGDSDNDMTAASDAGIRFIARDNGCGQNFFECGWKIKDFFGLEKIMAEFNGIVNQMEKK